MKIKYVRVMSFSFMVLALQSFSLSNYDLTLVGPVKFADSIPGIIGGFISCLHDSLKINVIYKYLDFQDMPSYVKEIVTNPNKTPGRVAIFTNLLWGVNGTTLSSRSLIKIAYSMLEATAIPTEWVNTLNRYFDAVVVPDVFLVKVYASSGVKIPIFVLPMCLHLDDFLDKPSQNHPHNPFTFGISAGFGPDKNHELVLEAFRSEFGNSENVQLIIHGRALPDNPVLQNLSKYIERYKLTNVKLNNSCLSRSDYIKFMQELDCYVLLSRGEGFSITPREALALGIPCILSNNTAQGTLCATGLVESVPAEILVTPDYNNIFGKIKAYKFNCKLEDACKALRNVYYNYDSYLAKAQDARVWVRQYLPTGLKDKYLSLIKPKRVTLGRENKIENGYLMTNSPVLYNKYIRLIRR